MDIEKSYGVVVVLRGKEDLYLLLKMKALHWSFPKGHAEGNETPLMSALRELKEESGITDCEILESPQIFDEYLTKKKHNRKIVQYFIGFAKNDKVVIQEEEIVEYKWATYEEAIETFTYEGSKEVLKIVKEYLSNHDRK